MSFAIFLFLPFIFQYVSPAGFYQSLLQHGRLNRHCHEPRQPTIIPGDENKFSLFIIFISGLIFVLIFLGIIKGIIGVCCYRKVGSYGLNLLIDLPRPLPRYQEKPLERRPVVYDIGGWPVHPDTLEKTVRVVPKRTEFCLNLVFFLACPVAACVYMCALCCCIKNFKSQDNSACFKHINVVRMTNHKVQKNKKSKEDNGLDVYKEDFKEDQDTKYVIDAMQRSKESIHQYNIKTCTCDFDE